MTTICYNSLLTPALLPPSWVILGGKIAPTHESYLSPSFMQRQVLTKLTVTRLNRLFLYIIFLTTENKDQFSLLATQTEHNASLIPSKSFLQVKMNGNTDKKSIITGKSTRKEKILFFILMLALASRPFLR